MHGPIPVFDWFVATAIASTMVLAAGTLGVLFYRQPARRVRLIGFTLAACTAVPLLVLMPGLPSWTVGWPQPELVAGQTGQTAAPTSPRSESLSPAPPVDTADEAPVTPGDPAIAEAPATPAASPEAVRPAIGAPRADAGENKTATPPLAAGPDSRVWIVAAYLVGVVASGAWWLLGLACLVRLVRGARPAPAHCQVALKEVGEGPTHHVRLLVSDRATQPLTFTWWRPVILLPAAMCDEGDSDYLRCCLAHEWEHVAGRHALAWWLAGLSRVVFFYNPLVWWMRSRLRLWQDYLADAGASNHAAEPEDYAELLAHMGRQQGRVCVAMLLGMGGTRSDLYRRVVMLLQSRRPLETRCPRSWSLTVAVLTALLLGLAVTYDVAPAQSGEPAIQEAMPQDARFAEILDGNEDTKDEEFQRKSYRVEKVVDFTEVQTGRFPDFARLMSDIQAMVAPHSWAAAGGAGKIASNEKDVSIEVVQSAIVHDALAKYLGDRAKTPAKDRKALVNYELQFDGRTCFVDSPTLKYDGSHPITVEAVVTPLLYEPLNLRRVSQGGIESIIADTEYGGIELGIDPRMASFMVFDGTPYASAISLGSRLGWARIHLAGVFEGENVSLYEDGRLVAEATAKRFSPSRFSFLIGASPHPHHKYPSGVQRSFHGRMDEVRFSKVARYTGPFAPVYRLEPDEDTIALYHFDEGTGDVARDSSGNGHHGRVYGAQWVKVPQ